MGFKMCGGDGKVIVVMGTTVVGWGQFWWGWGGDGIEGVGMGSKCFTSAIP